MSVFIKKIILLFIFVAVLAAGFPVTSVKAADDAAVEITVVKNDTVISLCRQYLDEPSQWPEIVRINRLKDHNLIYPGQKLIIPVRYLKGLPAPGRVAFFKGDVAYRGKSDSEWKPLFGDELLEKGASIQTGSNGTVEILFDDGTSFIQKPDTIVDISATQQKADGSLWRRFFLHSGRLILHVRRALGKEQRMEIQTPAAVAAARGTAFRVRVDGRGDTVSEVLDGRVDVGAMGRRVELAAGQGTRVKKGEPPIKPRPLLLPPELVGMEDLYRSLPFALTVKAVPEAVSHRFVLSREESFKDVISERVLPVCQPFEVSQLDDGDYYLSVRSIDDAGLEGMPSKTKQVRVRVNPLPPFIQSPADGVSLKSKRVSLSWLHVAKAVQYEIELLPDSSSGSTGVQTIKTSQTGQDLTLTDFGDYSFRIRSIADDGFEGVWSDRINFRLIAPPPAPPLDKPQIEETLLRIRWKDQGPKMTYRCQIAKDQDFTELIADQTVSGPQLIVERPSRPGRYYVRTKTIDEDGYEGGFSEPQIFEIKSETDRWVVLGAYGALLLLILLIL